MQYRGYKTQLEVNNAQQTVLRQHLGCARWAYNWALAQKKFALDTKIKMPDKYELHKEFVKLKKTTIPWMRKSSKAAPQMAIYNCDAAFQNFFANCKKGKPGKKGFPKFKSKKNEKKSFTLIGTIKVTSSHVQLPVIGLIKLAERNYLPAGRKILSATVSTKAGKWFVSVLAEEPEKEFVKAANEVIGVDLGIKTLVTLSDGTSFANSKPLKANLNKLKLKNRQYSRKKKGSENRKKAQLKLALLHYRIANIRRDTLHKITSKLINENQVIVLEDLKVSNMLKNHCLAQAISDVGMYEFRRQIEYKAKWSGRQVIFADTYYPSSKLCSSCGWKDEKLTLKDRIFNCKCCSLSLDRDYNAAINIKNYYLNNLSSTASSAGIYASGDRSSSLAEMQAVSLSLKEESNIHIE